MRTFGKWLGIPNFLTDYLPPTPAKAIPHPIPEGMAGVYRLLQVAHGHQQVCLVTLLGLVGCRVSEAISVTHKDVNLHEMTLRIMGKGQRERIVPLSTNAWNSMAYRVTECFVTDTKEPLVNYQDRYARKLISDLGVKARLQRHISTHDLRATFATAALNGGANIRVVQELLGHSSSATTEIYTGVSMTDMKAAVEL